MHQLTVQCDGEPAGMTAPAPAIARRGAPPRRSPDLPQATHLSDVSERAALGFAPREGEARFSSYIRAACIAAGLVAAWLGLCII
jgi:hypothetical protein